MIGRVRVALVVDLLVECIVFPSMTDFPVTKGVVSGILKGLKQ